MLHTLTIIGVLIAIALPLIDMALFRPGRKSLAVRRVPAIERLIYLGFLFAIAVQGLTSFGTILKGERMHGWALIAHMSVAGLFAVCVTALALLWAEQSTFYRAGEPRFHAGEKVAFWFTLLFGLSTILSAMFTMMGWFASPVQVTLLKVHRYSALILLICAVFHGYRLLIGRPKTSATTTTTAAAAGAGA